MIDDEQNILRKEILDWIKINTPNYQFDELSTIQDYFNVLNQISLSTENIMDKNLLELFALQLNIITVMYSSNDKNSDIK